MNGSLERQLGNDGCIHVGKSHAGMLSEDVPPTGFAPFAIAVGGLVVGVDVVSSARDLYRVGFPQCERVDGSRGPDATRVTMTISHGGRLAADRELNRAAKAAATVCFFLTHSTPRV